MPLSYATYTGNGSTTTFSVPFPYLLKSHVKVFIGFNILTGTYTSELVDGVGFTWSSGTQIQCTTAPTAAQTLTVTRQTPSSSRIVDWNDGSNLIAADMDTADLQNLYVVQEQQDRNDAGISASLSATTAANTATTAANTATSTANTALSTANTALTNANTAVSTANTASTNASAAVTTANTASTNASAAVTTANTASTNASAAVTTANAASATATTASTNASTALTTANTAATDAATALSTANTASTNASAAVATANTASTDASNALSTANTASANASAAVSTANTASTNASAAVTTANSADSKADQAIAAVAAALLYTIVANVAAIPGSPSNGDAIEITDSTGIESFTPLTGIPSGFVGDSGLGVRLTYQSSSTSWVWAQYFAQDPENRYAGPNTNTGSASSPSIAFGPTDTNTGIYSPGADQVAISTNGSERFRVNATGQVGIGGSPGTALDVIGAGTASTSIRARNDSTSVYLDANNGYSFLNTFSNHPFLIATNNTERLRITSGGLVGVGTSAPSTRLHILQDTNAAQLRIESTSSGNRAQGTFINAHSQWDVGVSGGTTGQFIIATATENVGLGIYTRETGQAQSEKVTITSAGRVGVGTTSPTESLEVVGNAILDTSNATLKIKQGVTGTTGAINFTLNTDSTSYGSLNLVYDDRITQGLRLNTVYPLTLECGAAEEIRFTRSTTESARIDSSGRFLLGTSTPVASTSNASGNTFCLTGSQTLSRSSSDANSQYIEFVKQRAGGTVVNNNDRLGQVLFEGYDGTNPIRGAEISAFVDGTPGANDMPGRLIFSTTADGASSPTERLRIDSSGRVGIGTTSPAYELDVLGSIRAQTQGRFANGSAAVPSYAFNGDDDTGVFRADTNQLGFSTGGTERARIDSSGRLLVGTSTASGAKLEVDFNVASASTVLALTNSFDWGYDTSLDFNKPLSAGGSVATAGRITSYYSSANNYGLQFYTVGSGSLTERMRIEPNGAARHVASDFASFARTNTDTVNLVFVQFGRSASSPTSYTSEGDIRTDASGNIAFANASDISLKTNIRDLSDCLSTISSLRPVVFDWKEDYKPCCTDVKGFIAQEFEQVLPKSVATNEDGIKSLAPATELFPLLVGAIKELNDQVAKLQAKVAALESA